MRNEQLNHAEHLCQARGARLTTQRRAVLALIYAAGRPLSAYEILDRLRDGGPAPAPPTVYRALDFLLEQGLVHRLESLHAFVACSQPEQHRHAGQFLICSDCGGVCELDDEAITAGLRATERSTGFRTAHPIVELLGTCARCAGGQQPAAGEQNSNHP